MMVPGNVTVLDDSTEVFTPPTSPNLAMELYLARKRDLPNKDHPKGCIVVADVPTGATSMTVDNSEGYVVGDKLGDFDYVSATPDPGTGQYASSSVSLTITGLPDVHTIQFSPAVPGPVTTQAIKIGSKFGFQGTFAEWQAQVVPQLVKILRTYASASNGDAAAIVHHLQAYSNVVLSAEARISTSLGALQTLDDGVTETKPPIAQKVVPVVGGGSLQ